MTFGKTRAVQWWVRLLGAILLLLFVFLAYVHVGAAGFIWDDESHLTQNPSIVGPLCLADIWTSASAFFYLLAICCFLDSRERKRDGIFYWLTILFYVAAITSKPSTVMLPVVLGLCLWWREGGIKQRDLRLFLPFVLISLLASGWTIWEQKFHSHAIGADWLQTTLQRILISAD